MVFKKKQYETNIQDTQTETLEKMGNEQQKA